MPEHPHPKDVPGLEKVVGALESAERVDSEGPPFELCICDASGQIIAAAQVVGFDRMKAFSRAMAKIGFGADIIGDTKSGCDVTYFRADHVRDVFDDGSPSSRPTPLT